MVSHDSDFTLWYPPYSDKQAVFLSRNRKRISRNRVYTIRTPEFAEHASVHSFANWPKKGIIRGTLS